jgi:hypothetical protein
MYLGGGFKRKNHRWKNQGKQAGSLFLLLLVLVLVLDFKK